MRSTPVQDMGTLMNFVGTKNLTKTGSMNQMGSFGDLMNKAKGGAFAQNKPAMNSDTGKTPAADTLRSPAKVVKTEETVSQEVKTDGTQQSQMTDEQSQAVTEAGKEVIKEIAEEFGITEEDVEMVMEQLGLSLFGLFDPANLKQLVLALGGEQDASALLTNEGLFANLQNIIATAGEIQSELAGKLGMNQEELAALTEQLQEALVQTTGEGEPDLTAKDNFADILTQEAGQEQPKITVEVKSGDETVKLSADENGNAVRTLEVVSDESASEAGENVVKEEAGRQEQRNGDEAKGHSENALNTGSQFVEGLVQNKAQNVEMPMEQPAAFFNEQTQEIMDQIMDYMKIQLKPGMSQLEMQLYPENLGTVHIQLVSGKGGEVTAQFHVQNEAVRTAVESQVNTLVENLREQGVKVEAVQVSVESHGFESNLWQGQGKEEEASSQNGRKTPRRINLNDLSTLPEEEADEEEILAAKMMEVNGNTVDYTV